MVVTEEIEILSFGEVREEYGRREHVSMNDEEWFCEIVK
jgi:hypothetical protein